MRCKCAMKFHRREHPTILLGTYACYMSSPGRPVQVCLAVFHAIMEPLLSFHLHLFEQGTWHGTEIIAQWGNYLHCSSICSDEFFRKMWQPHAYWYDASVLHMGSYQTGLNLALRLKHLNGQFEKLKVFWGRHKTRANLNKCPPSLEVTA